MLSFSFSNNLFFLGIVSAVLIAILIWFLDLKKRIEIYFPAVTILKKEIRKPKISFIRPPLIIFFCSLLSLMAFVFYCAKPHFLVLKPSQKGLESLHIFVDLSPSVTANNSLEQYKKKIYDFLKQEKKNYKITLSSSLSETIFPQEKTSVFFKSIEFHKQKTNISEKISYLVQALPEVDLFLIFSDQDQNSWKDFYWESISKEKKIVRFSSEKKSEDKDNFFVHTVTYIGKKRGIHTWDVKISRLSHKKKSSGTLSLLLDKVDFPKKEWEIKENETSTYVNYSVEEKMISKTQEILTWKIQPKESDLIQLDNEYLTVFEQIDQEVSLIADPKGEFQRKDPASHLEIMLHLFDFKVTRYDLVPKVNYEKLVAPFVISFLEENEGDPFYHCPKNLENSEEKKVKIWLAKETSDDNYTSLCSCLDALAKTLQLQCSSFLSKEDFSKILKEKKFKQVGGSLGFSSQALAWQFSEEKKNKDITVFMIPLYPSRKTGLTYDKFPVFLSLLLEENKNPRQISSQNPLSLNVDQEESFLFTLSQDKLPPIWQGSSLGRLKADSLMEQKESFFIILTLLVTMILALLVESFVHLKQKVIYFLLFFLVPLVSQKSFGAIDLTYYKPEKNLLEVSKIAFALSDVTSSFLNERIKAFSRIEDTLFEEPWIWINGSFLSDFDKNKETFKKLIVWIQQGGILIVEGKKQEEIFKKIEKHMSLIEKSSWQNVPLEHELLRSFFLLKSLPACDSDGWQILEYEKRIAAIHIPFELLKALNSSEPRKNTCFFGEERLAQSFINIVMVALTLDYKKDQIHLDEILKRLN